MSNTNGIISPAIGWEPDLYGAVGITAQKGPDGNAWYDLGFSGADSLKRINIWARYKYMRFNKLDALTENERKLAGFGVRADNIYVDTPAGRTEALENALKGSFGWHYDPPRGGTEVFRSTDMNGYDSNAVCPFYLRNGSANGLTLRIHFGGLSGLSSGNMTANDITGIIGSDNPAYSGYGIIYRRGSTVFHKEAINSAGTGVNYPIANASGGVNGYDIELDTTPGDYEVCVYILDLNRGNAVLLPCAALRINVAYPTAPFTVVADLDTSTSKPTFKFTVTAREAQAAATATLTLTLGGSTKYTFTYSVPYIAAGQSYSESEKLEVARSEFDAWSFTYKTTTIRG